MRYRKPKDNLDTLNDTPEVLGLDPMGWLFALVSAVVGEVTDTIILDNMMATAQKSAYPELTLGLLMFGAFVMSGGTLFALLYALRRHFGW
jgi:hypothetical protein